MTSGVLDTLLDRTVVPGYTRLGLAARRRLPGWPADPPRLDGKVVLITGAGSGLGRAAAEQLARLGAGVRVLTRAQDRSDQLASELSEATGGDVRGVQCDISDLGSLRAFCDGFLAAEQRLDVLVNNAGTMPAERTTTKDGLELTFATHVLGPWVLIDRLSGLLTESAPSRVINVVSGGMYTQRLDLEGLQGQDGAYSKMAQYAKTKRAEVVMTEQWAEKLAAAKVFVHSMHPGWSDTEGVRDSLPVFRAVTRLVIRDASEGADTIVWLAGAPDAVGSTGDLWHDRRRRPTHYLPRTQESPAERARLWEMCAALADQR